MAGGVSETPRVPSCHQPRCPRSGQISRRRAHRRRPQLAHGLPRARDPRGVRQGGGSFPFVLLHDVGWPYGRRDLYYEPGRIPAPHRHPHRQEGMRPGRADLDPGGGLNKHLFNARHEGGPRNGVLTAVEDFMDRSGLDLRLLVVPGINSLALLYRATLDDPGSPVADLLEEIRSGSALRQVLEKVEELRLEYQVEAIDRQLERDSDRAVLVSRESEITELQKTLNSVTRERDAARNEVAHLNETDPNFARR